MANLINFDAIPEAKRPDVKLNMLAYMPNAEPDKYTDLEWVEKQWREIFKKANKNGNDIRIMKAAEPIDDIFESQS